MSANGPIHTAFICISKRSNFPSDTSLAIERESLDLISFENMLPLVIQDVLNLIFLVSLYKWFILWIVRMEMISQYIISVDHIVMYFQSMAS